MKGEGHNAAKFHDDLQNNEVFASANINCPNNTEKEISFALNNDLTITAISRENITYQKTGTISRRSDRYPK